jgi:formate hydrogenlyase transcriptional activator
LIEGETGSGKEVIAGFIHALSQRRHNKIIKINCAAIPSGLLESELFGHERGAFTGAVNDRVGRFQLAHKGTLFLDEIGDLPSELQPKLLRVLQDRQFERLGSSKPVKADVRVIAATHSNLAQMVEDGMFREDLYYRLNVFPLTAPPLRDRGEDILLLARYFVQKFALRMGKRVGELPPEVCRSLLSYDWPGNVRELQNVIERAVIVSESDALYIDERWLFGRQSRPRLTALPHPGTRLVGTLATREKDAIEEALIQSMGRVSGPFGAAVRLGIPSSTLESKIKALKIDKGLFRPQPCR